MERLLLVGFEKFGEWTLVKDDQVSYSLNRHAPHPHTLYAFVSSGEVLYVGKTTKSLRGRLQGYAKPSATQSTNLRNHARIRSLLTDGEVVEIWALPDRGLHRFGPFHLNLAAGLEDSIIGLLNPPWNGGRKESIAHGEEEEVASTEIAPRVRPIGMFDIVLQPTYHATGFFNIPVAEAFQFGADGQVIELFLGEASEPVLGTINRTANRNHTPRIMGGGRVREWFQAEGKPSFTLSIKVLSPTSIRLALAYAIGCGSDTTFVPRQAP